MYITPERFRAMGFGVKVDDLSDADLSIILSRAAADIHTYTNVAMQPLPHDFRGGSVVGESHTWRLEPYDTNPSRRVWLYHPPVRVISSARIYMTNDQYVELAPDHLYYEPSEGWIEPTSAALTSFGLFGATVLPFVGLSEPHLVTDYTYGQDYPVTERLYYADSGYRWIGSVGNWRSDPVVVRVNGVTTPDADYAVDRVEGSITFSQNFPQDGDVVDADYVGSLHPDIALAQGVIAANKVTEKNLVASGMGNLRALRVAELSIERDYRRNSGNETPPTVPPEAAALLDPFVIRALAFA